MKPFQQYIFEINKLYEFRIKIATVEPKGDVMDRIKHALDTYQLESVGPVKRLPIQEHREFPQWGPCECWYFDVKVAYPVNSVGIRQVVKERAQINSDWIMVYNLSEAEYNDEFEAEGKDHEGALLDVTELKDKPGAQELVGQRRISSMMKELATRKFDVQGTDKTDGKNVVTTGKTTNSVPQGDISAMGTTRNKIPSPMKGR
jgi:hypothetical protein